MSSINQQIAECVKSAIVGVSVAGDSVSLDRVTPITRDEAPWINVKRSRETKQASSSNGDFADLTVQVCIYVRDDEWGAAADEIAVAAHRALMADTQLRELAERIRHIGSGWDDHDADETAGCLTLEYAVRYAVNAADISNSTIL